MGKEDLKLKFHQGDHPERERVSKSIEASGVPRLRENDPAGNVIATKHNVTVPPVLLVFLLVH